MATKWETWAAPLRSFPFIAKEVGSLSRELAGTDAHSTHVLPLKSGASWIKMII